MNTPKGHSAEKQENVSAEDSVGAAGGGNCPGPANSALPPSPVALTPQGADVQGRPGPWAINEPSAPPAWPGQLSATGSGALIQFEALVPGASPSPSPFRGQAQLSLP